MYTKREMMIALVLVVLCASWALGETYRATRWKHLVDYSIYRLTTCVETLGDAINASHAN